MKTTEFCWERQGMYGCTLPKGHDGGFHEAQGKPIVSWPTEDQLAKINAETITREEYQAEWDAGWPNVHPEDYCQRCLSRNITWTIDSDRFNLAAEALGLRGTSIICIACFVEGHQKATALQCSWTLQPFTHFSPL